MPNSISSPNRAWLEMGPAGGAFGNRMLYKKGHSVGAQGKWTVTMCAFLLPFLIVGVSVAEEAAKIACLQRQVDDALLAADNSRMLTSCVLVLFMTALGAAMLWVGWFGLNSGRELLSDGLTSNACCTTHFFAEAGAVAWAVMECFIRGSLGALGIALGAVTGLVCITPAARFVQPMTAVVVGAAASIVCFLFCTTFKSKLGYDDSVDVFGTLGTLLTGVFATRACSDIANGGRLGLIEGETSVLIGQIIALLPSWSLGFFVL